MIRRAALAFAGAAVLSACAGTAADTTASLNLPARNAAVLADATLYTSPDGGIYQNPDAIQVRLVERQDAGALVHLFPQASSGWQQLRSLGDFTLVGISVRNNGKARSDPQLNAVQIASDFAPDGTSTGPLRHYYHPLFPLGVLTQTPSDSSCSLHIDPGQTTVAVLVYPPVRATQTIVWGVYNDFAVRARFGGALPPGSYAWRASVCTPPSAPPSA